MNFDQAQGQVPNGFLKGLKEVKWPGRGQILRVQDTKYDQDVKPKTDLTWYLDGAHTVESLEVGILFLPDREHRVWIYMYRIPCLTDYLILVPWFTF